MSSKKRETLENGLKVVRVEVELHVDKDMDQDTINKRVDQVLHLNSTRTPDLFLGKISIMANIIN